MKFKKYSTATDTYTTLPATFQTSGADAVNYQVYGETVENLFDDTAKDTSKGYVSGSILLSDGTVTRANGFYVSEYIPISGSQIYTFYLKSGYETASLCFYDASKNYADGEAYNFRTEITTTTPSNAAYVRFSVREVIEADLMLVKGSTAPTRYVPYGTPDGVGEETANLFVFETVTFGKYIDSNGVEQTGSSAGASTLNHTDYIEVEPSSDYVFTGFINPTTSIANTCALCWFDENKAILSRNVFNVSTSTVYYMSGTSPANAKYLIVNFIGYTNTMNSKFMVTQSSTAPASYVPSGYKIPILNTSGVTENLWDEDYIDISSTLHYRSISVGEGNFTLSTTTPLHQSQWASIFLLSGQVSEGASTSTNGVWNGSPRTVEAVNGYVTIGYRLYSDSGISPANYDTMLNAGSTALPYAPNRYTSNYDLFIGDTKLGEDEHLDYGEQKVYKRTENKYDDSTTTDNYRIIWSTGALNPDSNYRISDYISVSESTSLTFSGLAYCIGYDANKTYLGVWNGEAYKKDGTAQAQNTITIPGGTAFIRLTSTKVIMTSEFMVVANTTVPASFIPYLQPTDPPVPFPTLTTYLGENSIDVDTTVQPEKVVLTVAAWREIEAKKYVNGSWTDIVVRRYENGAWVPSPIPENNIANLQGLLTLLEDHWLPGVNDYRSMILVRTNRNDDTANQLCYMLTCYSTNPSPHFASEFLTNRYWLNDFAEPYRSGTDFYLRKFSWTQGGGWVYDGYEDNKRDDYFVPIDSNTYNVYLLRLGSSTQYDNNAGYQYFYDLSAYF